MKKEKRDKRNISHPRINYPVVLRPEETNGDADGGERELRRRRPSILHQVFGLSVVVGLELACTVIVG